MQAYKCKFSVIGGIWNIKDSISDTAGTPKFFISGSPGATNNMADTNLFISSSGFQVNSTEEIRATTGLVLLEVLVYQKIVFVTQQEHQNSL